MRRTHGISLQMRFPFIIVNKAFSPVFVLTNRNKARQEAAGIGVLFMQRKQIISEKCFFTFLSSLLQQVDSSSLSPFWFWRLHSITCFLLIGWQTAAAVSSWRRSTRVSFCLICMTTEDLRGHYLYLYTSPTYQIIQKKTSFQTNIFLHCLATILSLFVWKVQIECLFIKYFMRFREYLQRSKTCCLVWCTEVQ